MTAASDRDADGEYARLFPYHAEIAALSELRKKPGFGVKLRSGMGGHCLLYLNGVRRVKGAGYPVLELCPPDQAPARSGAGISVNSHYRNANWVASEGRDFIWRGVLRPGERLTRDAYARTQAAAMASGMLEGIEFHDHLFAKRPAGMSAEAYMYEISVATDYAACFGRDAYRARVPLDAARMQAVVDYLNALNAPYRAGERVFTWRIFNNNCVHVAHNALAAAGVWPAWPTGQFVGRAMFRFPVPKNSFVDLMRHGNDIHPDARGLARKPKLRRHFEATGRLPAAPGTLALATPAVAENDVYDVRRLRLIFFDDPFIGPYRFRFARIFAEPRYQDLRANLRHFAARYAAAAPASAGVEPGLAARHARHLAAQAEAVHRHLAELDAPAAQPELAAE